MRRRPVPGAIPVALLLASVAGAFQADLVPVGIRPETVDLEGSVSIGGDDGRVRIRIEGVNDARGEPLDSTELAVHLKLRVNGVRRRITIPLAVEAGDGEASASLGLAPESRLIVGDVRVRGPSRRPLAAAGAITRAPIVDPAPPLPPGDAACADALASCREELAFCVEELGACELAE